MNSIGENIAVLRKAKGMTQEVLALAIGVSAQSVSKWENDINMPDVAILPIIADVFGVSIDTLFGRRSLTDQCRTDEAFDKCVGEIQKTMVSCMYNPDIEESFESALERYTAELEKDNRVRSGVIRKHGIVYYRDEIGAILLKKPSGHWMDLLCSEDAARTLELLANRDFRTALAEIIRAGKNVFTLASLCRACGIEDASALEKIFAHSGLFTVKNVDVDGENVAIYELARTQKLMCLFGVLTYAREFELYENCYTMYYGDSGFYLA